MVLVDKVSNIYGDEIGFIEQYDFSRANLDYESRVKAVTTVASICYASEDRSIGSEKLFTKLQQEALGLPSSSFEFVPVLLSMRKVSQCEILANQENFNPLDIEKFGEYVENNKYLLTNLRALLNTVGEEYIDKFYNTEEECEIIKKHFKVFKLKIDLPTRSQLVRHSLLNLQELSRRYTTDKKVPIELYLTDSLKDFEEELKEMIDIYKVLIKKGVKAEEARRVLPQGIYTQIWVGFQPRALKVFLGERTKSSAQKEIRIVAKEIEKMLKKD